MSGTTTKLQAAARSGSPDEVEAAFYEGLRSGNVDQLMACWADEDDIACIHPGGVRLMGAAAIRAAFEAMFANGGAVPVTAEQTRRIESVASAVHHVLERVDLLTPQGAAQGYVLATNVYQQTTQGWRLVVHHASPGSPVAMQGIDPIPKVLH